MRLALYHSLPSGGAKRALYETARRLAQDHEVTSFTLSTAARDYCDLRPFVQREHVYAFRPLPLLTTPLGRLNQLQRWRDLRRLRRLEAGMAAHIDSEGYEAVYVQPSQWTQAPPVLLRLRTPSVYFLHEAPRFLYEPPVVRAGAPRRRWDWLNRWDPLLALYYSSFKRMDWEATRQASLVLANSRFTAASAQRIYQRPAVVHYFGVDTAAFRPVPGLARANRVLSVGALRPNKGFDFLIRAVGRLPAKTRPGLTLIGNADDAHERAYLEQLARACAVTLDIEVLVDQARLVHHYSAASLFVYAPLREPLGLAPLEAMACGTPVVAVADGGVPETVVDGLTGRLVPRDRDQFAAAVAELLADAPARERLGRQARAHVETAWSWDRSTATLARHLAGVAAGAGGPAADRPVAP